MSSSERLLFDRTTIPLMSRGLDAYALRQKAISNNLANTETDGYQRRTVEFEAELAEAISEKEDALRRTHPDHLPKPWELRSVTPRIAIDESEDYYNGHNNIDIDREMTELSRAVLSFQFSARATRGAFESLQLAIKGMR